MVVADIGAVGGPRILLLGAEWLTLLQLDRSWAV